jgi:hypothetical protein
LLWVEPPEEWIIERKLLPHAVPKDRASSTEQRILEFEIQAPEDASSGISIPSYALYHVCEGKSNASLYRRQDLEIDVALMESAD